MKDKLIKSKKRVKDFAEVFTPDFIVRDMCDLIPAEVWERIDSTFLEPACGTGNFLVEILARKYSHCKTEKDGLKALASIVGIDIQADNCDECRRRLMAQFMERFPAQSDLTVLLASGILQNNIICGDSIKIQEKWLKAKEQTK